MAKAQEIQRSSMRFEARKRSRMPSTRTRTAASAKKAEHRWAAVESTSNERDEEVNRVGAASVPGLGSGSVLEFGEGRRRRRLDPVWNGDCREELSRKRTGVGRLAEGDGPTVEK